MRYFFHLVFCILGLLRRSRPIQGTMVWYRFLCSFASWSKFAVKGRIGASLCFSYFDRLAPGRCSCWCKLWRGTSCATASSSTDVRGRICWRCPRRSNRETCYSSKRHPMNVPHLSVSLWVRCLASDHWQSKSLEASFKPPGP